MEIDYGKGVKGFWEIYRGIELSIGVKKGWSPCHLSHFLQNKVLYEETKKETIAI